MAVYRVWAKMTSYCYLDVEADSVEDALNYAENADGGDFIEDPASGDWEMLDDEVEELED